MGAAPAVVEILRLLGVKSGGVHPERRQHLAVDPGDVSLVEYVAATRIAQALLIVETADPT